jgi:CMP-N,N'-diacetyllegionaminic acid synthase
MTETALAIVPARAGSKGIPGKNFRMLGHAPLVEHAIDAALTAGAYPVLSTDCDLADLPREWRKCHRLLRPYELAQDDTPMIAVVQHVLEQIPGPPDQPIVLLQPTQPLRKPEHITAALGLLRDSQADSVVSVVPVKPTDHCRWQAHQDRAGRLLHNWNVISRRQDLPPAYKRDGTVYAFWRKTVDTYGTIYGLDVRPLHIDPADSCELDTEADWIALERRWKERHVHAS